MGLPENDYQILRLTDDFYQAYPNPPYTEILKKRKRSMKHKSALDYTKIVIICKSDYIDTQDALIDNDEFNETMINLDRIKKEALKFVEDYVAHMSGTVELHPQEYRRRYAFSTLQYFHKELGIKK